MTPYVCHFRLITSHSLGNTNTHTLMETHKKAAGLSGQAPASTSAHISEHSDKLFSGENKLGSPSKRHFKKPVLFASSKEACLVNRHGEFTAQRYCRRYKRLELHHNKDKEK